MVKKRKCELGNIVQQDFTIFIYKLVYTQM